ncbi:MAG: FemAB family PEP-CTERM system-associated protein [Calditrichaeota bacterium]|nr:MAG: FemAB family PEP-CTERM system-associated protein [Calditrichota bacterium]
MRILYYEKDWQAWDAYVARHPGGTIYHTSAWYHIITRHFKKRVFYLAAEEGGALHGVLPLVHFKSPLFGKFMVSVPYVNYGGLLADNATAEQQLIREAAALRQKLGADFVELRDVEEKDYNLPVKSHKVTFYLDLPDDPDTLMASFKAKLRSQIRRPMKDGITAEVGGMELLNDFYDVFSHNMRDLGTPVYSKGLFKTILEETPENSRIVIVRSKEGQAIGGAFVHGYKQRLEIPWASTLRAFNRLSPNMLMYWEVLRYAIEAGYKQFDFGRCSRDSGTYRFKKQWGSTEHPLYWYYILPEGEELPEINPDNPKYRMAINLWQKLPVPITKMIGPSIIKHLP